MLGFMVGCAFLSMWVQNTSAVTMVMPIMEAVLQQILKGKEAGPSGEDNPNLQLDGTQIYSYTGYLYRGMSITELFHPSYVIFPEKVKKINKKILNLPVLLNPMWPSLLGFNSHLNPPL